jgi:hypothetical protein
MEARKGDTSIVMIAEKNILEEKNNERLLFLRSMVLVMRKNVDGIIINGKEEMEVMIEMI